jgi:NADP-dependent 3-hydroxy acid dehydrogenase YdfG
VTDEIFTDAKERMKNEPGGLKYHKVDVTNGAQLKEVIEGIGAEKQRVDGLIAGMKEPVHMFRHITDCSKRPECSR